MKRGKIIVKQSLSDAYRQYLEDVTIPMNTYLDAPEEFVTTKPSIYHSIRMQPATDARTGRVRNSPARARALSSYDNLQFQNDIRDFSLPLSTNQGLPLYGRHVYPGELYSFNPSFGKETHLPDLPVTYKQTWGDGTRNRPLNLYGFTGNAPTPQRFTSSTFQPEGIIYGNLDENDVIQLNTRPASAERFAQVARALSPFHPNIDIKHLGGHSEDLARDIMDAGIPPILAESNVDTRGRTHHLPFRLDEPIDVKEAHDPFAQYDMGNLNRPTPEGLGQFTLDAIRAGEPMEIAMQLLKEEVDVEAFKRSAYGLMDEGWADHLPEDFDYEGFDAENYNEIIDRKYPTGQIGYSPGIKELRRSLYNHYESPEENEKRFRDLMDNPTREPILVVRDRNGEEHIIAGHHRMAASIESNRPHLPALILDMNKEFPPTHIQTGEPMDIAMQLLKEEVPYGSRDYPPREISISTGNPLVTPKVAGETPEVCNMPGCESGLPPVMYRRMANPIRSIDNHEFICEQCAYKHDLQSLLFDKMIKGEITPIEYAMRLLKEEPLYLQGSNTLARRARKELETDKTGANSPAYQEMMERMMDIYEPQDETISLEDNLDLYAQETGINPWRSSPGQEIPNKHGGTAKVHLAPLTPIHTQPFYQWQAKNASEPMEIAMQLLKRELHPGRDIEGYLKDDGHYAGEEELYNLNDPEVQNFVNRLHLDKQPPVHLIPETLGMDLGYVEPELRVENRDTKLYHPMMMDEHENLDKFPNRKIVEREDGTKEELVSTSDPTSDVVGVGRTGRTLISPKPTFEDIPFSEETGFTRSEPMEIAMQLLKERVSPEAKRHKLEYDKKYESSPERVKYREELNRERRRRHIMGQGGPDMSHTARGTIVPESPHTNRARHFKDKGTLL